LELVGLAEAAKKRAGLYSHGMLKRLAMARALMADPELLLLDEATHDLDPLGSEDVKAITRSLSRNGATVVWATQRLAELSGFAHTTTVLQDGVTRFSGPVSELSHLADVRSFRLRFAGEIPKAGDSGAGVDLETTEAPGVLIAHLSSAVTLGEVISGFTAAGFQITSCTEVTSEIESAFLRLVT
jgi:ABC-2 type transport system ATP-binding protein